MQAAPTTAKGLSLAALITGGVAFFIGWVPVLGLIVGSVAITLGVLALVKKQSKALSIVAMSLGTIAALTSLVMILVFAFATSSAVVASSDGSNSTSAEDPAVEEPVGPEVPDLAGQTGDVADDELQELGFETEFDAGDETVIMRSNWTVTGTTPAAGEFAELGSTVVIHVEKIEPDSAEAEATSLGLTGTYAWSACNQMGDAMFPYGFRFHLTGIIADEPQGDTWFLKASITTENEFGNKRKDQVMECYVTGTNEAPEVSDFLVY